jgi:hypothetical protein
VCWLVIDAHANIGSDRLTLRRFIFVLVLLTSRMLLLVIDRSDYEHDYEQEHEGSFGCIVSRDAKFPG